MLLSDVFILLVEISSGYDSHESFIWLTYCPWQLVVPFESLTATKASAGPAPPVAAPTPLARYSTIGSEVSREAHFLH